MEGAQLTVLLVIIIWTVVYGTVRDDELLSFFNELERENSRSRGNHGTHGELLGWKPRPTIGSVGDLGTVQPNSGEDLLPLQRPGPPNSRGGTGELLSGAALARAAMTPTNRISIGNQDASEMLTKASQWMLQSHRGRPGVSVAELAERSTDDLLFSVGGGGLRRGGWGGGEPRPFHVCRQRNVTCDPEFRFRSIDGICNNLKNPLFGASFVNLPRLIPPAYEDEISAPRARSASGPQLPSARDVSLKVYKSNSEPSAKQTQLMMQWGQYLAHDVTLTPLSSAGSWGGSLGCQQCSSPTRESANCFPIAVPKDDPQFRAGTCLPFTRSAAGQLKLGTRQQTNELTSFIDASSVYGSDDSTAKQLREFRNGRLKVQINGLLPPDRANPACKVETIRGQQTHCFKAGDVRSSVQMGLSAMHTLWVHEHNKIADRLAVENRHWGDEIVYQEARKLIGAMHQHITFNEFLPNVIGETMMQKYGLKLKKDGFATDYNDGCDATIFNEFSTAGFRFGHTLIDAKFQIGRGDRNNTVSLDGRFFDPSFLHADPQNNFRKLLLGMTERKCQKFDRNFDSVIRDRLFADKSDPAGGIDLSALNIQRGRDHGLPGYIHYRAHYALQVPKTFDDLKGWMRSDAVDSLKSVYRRVEDIDVYAGMVSENTLDDAMVGELTANFLGDQFSRLKRCDRFWYENDLIPSQFTVEERMKQLNNIRQVSLRNLLCSHMREDEFTEAAAAGATSFCPQSNQPDLPRNRSLFRFRLGHFRSDLDAFRNGPPSKHGILDLSLMREPLGRRIRRRSMPRPTSTIVQPRCIDPIAIPLLRTNDFEWEHRG